MKKKYYAVLLAVTCIFVSTSSLAVNDSSCNDLMTKTSIVEQEQLRIGGSGTHIANDLIASTVEKSWGFIAYHPSFSKFRAVDFI